MASYLEHMALKVSDIEWHVKFFEEVFDMPVRMTLGKHLIENLASCGNSVK